MFANLCILTQRIVYASEGKYIYGNGLGEYGLVLKRTFTAAQVTESTFVHMCTWVAVL